MNLQKIKKWEYIVNRSQLPLAASFLHAVTRIKFLQKYINITDNSIDGYIFVDNKIYLPQKTTGKIAQAQIKKYKQQGNKYLWHMADVCYQQGQKLINKLNSQIKSLPNNPDNEDLYLFWQQVAEQITEFAVFLVIPWSLEDYLQKSLQNILVKSGNNQNIFNIISKLSLPLKTNDSSKESEYFLKLVSIVQQDKKLKNIFTNKKNKEIINLISVDYKNFLRKIDKFINEYSWVYKRWFGGKDISRADILRQIKHSLDSDSKKQLRQIQKNKKENNKFFQDFIKKSNLSKKEVDFIKLVKEYVFLRTYRTDIINKAFGMLVPVLKQTAKALSVPYSDIAYYTYWEILDKLKGRQIKINVKQRKKYWTFLRIGDDYQIYIGKKGQQELIKRYKLSHFSETKIKGNVVFKGKARGRVKIVLNQDDIKKVKKGDILVAVMTFPSYIAAMRKAIAFVTDEGGILSHAAIVAREMKKPCIIGTKVATRILQDGDMVELDTANGAVKILNNK